MKIAFFGDSITAGMPGTSYFNMLCTLLPDHELVNFARGGDSVIGAHERTSKLKPSDSFDMAFLWIGTNDVFVKVSWTFPYIRKLMRQPWAKNMAEFKRYYCAILDNLHHRAEHVYAVSPWFVGEDVNNEWNMELEKLSAEVKSLSSTYKNVSYLDIRERFKSKLEVQRISNYVAKSALAVARDALMLKNLEQVNQRSSQRGLHYTLDGVHLNEQGAEIIARAFTEVINKT